MNGLNNFQAGDGVAVFHLQVHHIGMRSGGIEIEVPPGSMLDGLLPPIPLPTNPWRWFAVFF